MKILMTHTEPCIRVLKEIKALKRLKPDIEIQLLQTAPSYFQAELEKYADKIYILPMLTQRMSYLNLPFIYRLSKYIYKIVKQEKIDLIHTHATPSLTTLAAIRSGLNLPLIYDMHDVEALFKERHLLNLPLPVVDGLYSQLRLSLVDKIESYCLSNSSRVIVVSPEQKKFLIERFNVGKDKISIFMSAVSGSEFVVHKPNKNINKVVYIGTYSYISHRNISEYMKVLSKISDFEFHFYLLGGRLNKRFDNIVIHPGFERSRLFDVLCQYDIGALFFTPEKNQGVSCLDIALPNKLFEYMAAGLPVISPNFKNLHKFISSNQIGSTFPLMNPEDISNALYEIERNYSMYSKNVKSVRKKYTLERFAKQLYRVYEELVTLHP